LKYFTLYETSCILVNFARCGRGSDELIDELEKTFIKHRKALAGQEDTLEMCKRGFLQLNKGSEILKRVLEDPNTELPKLE
jgi:hypothetical protein